MPTAQSVLTRRAILGVGALGLGAIALRGVSQPTSSGAQLDPAQAFEQTQSGKITLIDIRRPDEWAGTGSGQGAVRIDLRDADFIARVRAHVGNDLTAPVALICARGVRSARISHKLSAAGFTNIIDVPEGMLGSAAGPGWLARGLPLDRTKP